MRRAGVIVGLLLALGLVGPAASAQAASGTDRTPVRAFVGATVIDGTDRAPVPNAVLVVRDGRVVDVGPAGAVRIPADAERVDLRGRYVMPGLINAHGHVLRLSDRDRYAAYGVTTVWSLGDEPDAVMEARVERDQPAPGRARVWAAGPVLAPATPAEARALVAAAHARGVDVIKIRVDDNLGTTRKMAPDVYRAVIAEARARGLRVAVHFYYLDDARDLLASGADFLGHSVRDTLVDDAFVSAVRASGRCYAPTLMREVSTWVYGETPDFFSDPLFQAHADPEWVSRLRDPEQQRRTRESASARTYRAQFDVALENLRRLFLGGVPIVLGTDTGPTGRFQGYFELMELELLVAAGLAPRDAIASATRVAADCMGLGDELGTLTPGRRADFVVLEGNPLADIRNVRRQVGTYIGGVPVLPR
jgi:imidazolonepropionase-like amidohydrolase